MSDEKSFGQTAAGDSNEPVARAGRPQPLDWIREILDQDGGPAPCSVLYGYLGYSDRRGDDFLRCYRSLQFDSYVDVEHRDVVRFAVREESTFPYHVLLIRSSATVWALAPGIKRPIAGTMADLFSRPGPWSAGSAIRLPWPWVDPRLQDEPISALPPCPDPLTQQVPCEDPLVSSDDSNPIVCPGTEPPPEQTRDSTDPACVGAWRFGARGRIPRGALDPWWTRPALYGGGPAVPWAY